MSYPSTTFPTTLDNPTNPTATDAVATFDHAGLEDFQNNAIVALETKVGINSSNVTTTIDYKLATIPASDRAASVTGSETLTNKTLTSPVINTPTLPSMYQDAGRTKLMSLPNTASDTLVALAAIQALTNKTITSTTNNIAAKSLVSATTLVDTSAATAPSSGQVLTATSSTTATWQAPVTGVTVTTVNAIAGFNSNGDNSQSMSSNTNLQTGVINIPYGITATKVSICCSSVSVAGTWKLALFSLSGASQIFSLTTVSVSGSGIVTTTIGSTVIPQGLYYIALLPVGTASASWFCYAQSGTDVNNPAGLAVTTGTLTVTASTMPATITPTSISSATQQTVISRFDA